MSPTRRTVAMALAGVLAAAALGACGESPNANRSNGEAATVLNIGMPNGPQTENHNPFLESSSASILGYRWQIYEPLALANVIRPADKPKPWLAQEYSWSADLKTLTVTAREGAKWSDGTAFSAEDIAFTYDLIGKTPAINRFALPIVSATATGNQASIVFERPQFVNEARILRDIAIVPKHLWSQIADPSTDIIKNPVGTGPYTLKTFTPQTTTLSVRTEGYWQQLPQVKELRYTSYNDNNAQTTALANGESEWSFVFIPNYQTVYIDKDPENNKIFPAPVIGIHGLYINTTVKPFDDPVLRRAMNMVINRNDIFVQAAAGYFHPEITSVTGIPTPAGDPYIAPEYKGQTHKVDVEGAKALLTGAGYTLDGTTLKDRSGKPVKIKLTDPAPWSDYITSLEIVKDNLSQIGIEATLDKATQDAWQKSIEEGTFEASFRWTNGGATPYDMYQTIMDGKLLKPIGEAAQNGNFGRFDNAEATAALEAYANATDDAARTTAMNTLQKIFVEQMPMIPVGADNAGGAYNVKNWVGWPSAEDPYAPAQPTQPNAVDVILRLKPAGA
ncbi:MULTISPECIES: ABC transporter substrate-binding protein [Catenuloplanes]|uniref:Peptide/nickel transport system substrate-binding protein n=1 Tax=Catenuloplanes niger TaxID=587534 RepID=A0AAE4CY80_9ACTN|nr:ABC transporter substrate-binding protein [Catenuloplanes niger]MDR7328212.1 peptide/nickel transport system substrate-binding protein [Catenuloplanes niger]